MVILCYKSGIMSEVMVEREQAFFWNLGPGVEEAVHRLLQEGIDGESLGEAQESGPFFLPTSLGRRLVAGIGKRLGLGFFREVKVTRNEQGQITWFSLPAETSLNDHTDVLESFPY